MSHLTPHTARFQSAQIKCQGASNHESPPIYFPASETQVTQPMGNRSHHPFIHILNDDSLLVIFNFCRPVLIDEDEDDEQHILEGGNRTRDRSWYQLAKLCQTWQHLNDDRDILQGGNWTRERWWYRLAQVCQRWRYLILASASYLDLCLLCKHGTPVADMLAHSPPLPLIIDYLYDRLRGHVINPLDYLTAEDKEGIALALQHRNRVRRIRLWMPVSIFKTLVGVAIDGEFPVLEYLYFEVGRGSFVFPSETFQAPRLRHLILWDIDFPIPQRLLTTCLVTLFLQNQCSSAYFPPTNLLQGLSPMLHLETLHIHISLAPSTDPNSEIDRQLLLTPITTTVTLPNLRWFVFGGPAAYLEALLLHITSPLLEKFQIDLMPRRSTSPTSIFRVSPLHQFMNAAENLRFGSVKVRFALGMADLWAYPRKGFRKHSFHMCLSSSIRQQLLDTAHIIREFTTVFSVEHLFLECGKGVVSSINLTEWRDFFGSFGSVKTLLVDYDLDEDISHFLRLDEGEYPMELLTELKELSYPYPETGDDADDVFIAFADARQKAGRPITLSYL